MKPSKIRRSIRHHDARLGGAPQHLPRSEGQCGKIARDQSMPGPVSSGFTRSPDSSRVRHALEAKAEVQHVRDVGNDICRLIGWAERGMLEVGNPIKESILPDRSHRPIRREDYHVSERERNIQLAKLSTRRALSNDADTLRALQEIREKEL
jgi:hypothetical protein